MVKVVSFGMTVSTPVAEELCQLQGKALLFPLFPSISQDGVGSTDPLSFTRCLIQDPEEFFYLVFLPGNDWLLVVFNGEYLRCHKSVTLEEMCDYSTSTYSLFSVKHAETGTSSTHPLLAWVLLDSIVSA